jgi:hypothetical protein
VGERSRLFFLVVTAAMLGSACVRKVAVPEPLPVQPPVPTDELMARINSYRDINGFAAQVEIQVVDYFTGKAGEARKFPAANGLIRLQRPENIRMLVSAPVISKKIADMASDGHQFRLAIYWPDDKRVFVRGSNLAEYSRLEAEQILHTQDPRLREAGALVNIRPQHLTDAFLIKPIDSNGQTEFFREEVRQIESGAKNKMVWRTYYVIYVLERGQGQRSYLRRKFWFDRTQFGTPLVRQQVFGNGDGRLASDIFYSDFFRDPGSQRLWPRRVRIERPGDGYGLTIIVEKDSAEINPQLPSAAFLLENTEGLREVDLDQPQKGSPITRSLPPLSNNSQ